MNSEGSFVAVPGVVAMQTELPCIGSNSDCNRSDRPKSRRTATVIFLPVMSPTFLLLPNVELSGDASVASNSSGMLETCRVLSMLILRESVENLVYNTE